MVTWRRDLMVSFLVRLTSKFLGVVVGVEAGGNSLLGQHDEGEKPNEKELSLHASFEF